jgi:hypothetical protein
VESLLLETCQRCIQNLPPPLRRPLLVYNPHAGVTFLLECLFYSRLTQARNRRIFRIIILIMIRTTVQRENNALHLSFVGQVEGRQFEELRRRLPSIMRCLGADFVLLTDLSEVEEFEFACVSEIASLMEWIVEAGVGEVVRVVPDPRRDIGFAILSAFHYPTILPVRIFTELEEAIQHVAKGSRPRQGAVEGYDCEAYLEAGYPGSATGAGV